jgi:hypothetical protein
VCDHSRVRQMVGSCCVGGGMKVVAAVLKAERVAAGPFCSRTCARAERTTAVRTTNGRAPTGQASVVRSSHILHTHSANSYLCFSHLQQPRVSLLEGANSNIMMTASETLSHLTLTPSSSAHDMNHHEPSGIPRALSPSLTSEAHCSAYIRLRQGCSVLLANT